ncbi:MAG: hypothetical protein ACKO96_35980 [Flammeovirgaceae bacterium]
MNQLLFPLLPSEIGQRVGNGKSGNENGGFHITAILQRWQNYITFEVFF